MRPDPLPVPCVLGPTGSGKTDVARWAARASEGEVIACDAFSVYRGMEILAAAPDVSCGVPHHLVAFLDPSEAYSAARFVEDADRLVAEIRARGRRPWVVGGTALYLRSWIKGMGARVARDEAYRAELADLARREGVEALHRRLLALDPARAAEVHPRDERRLVRALEIIRGTGRPASAQREEWEGPDRVAVALVGLRRAPTDLEARILARTRGMFEAGVVEEARRLLARPLSPEARMALGLAEIEAHLAGRLGAAEAIQEIARRTRRFARKQMTFFRSFGGVTWLDVAAEEPAAEVARRVLAAVGLPPGQEAEATSA